MVINWFLAEFPIRRAVVLLLSAALVASVANPLSGSAAAQALECPAQLVDIATAEAAEIETLAGMNRRSSRVLVRLREAGSISALEDLRTLSINDKRFRKFATDPDACFAGRMTSELLPSAVCMADEARINTSSVGAIASRIGWKNARPLVRARPLMDHADIVAIPERGQKILGRLARKGGTCLDDVRVDPAVFGEGRHAVGVDIAAGRYVATNVADCTWERSASRTGGAAQRTASDFRASALQVVVDIDASDASFASVGCGSWTPVDAQQLELLGGIPGDGDWLVSEQVAPGLYRASAVGRCVWTRSSAMGGVQSDVIEQAGLSSTSVLVQLQASDEAFTSAGCGAWSAVAAECLNQLEAVYPAEPEVSPHVYGVSDSVLLSTQFEIGLALPEYTVNWGGFGGLNVPSSVEIVEIEIGEGKVTGSTVIVGLGHNYRGVMEPFYAGYIDTLMASFPDHVDRVIWVAPSRFNTLMPFVVETLNEAVERWPQLEIADFWIEADAQNHPEWFPDDIHLDPEGRLVMADYLRDKLLNPCG